MTGQVVGNPSAKLTCSQFEGVLLLLLLYVSLKNYLCGGNYDK
jgi:hypothetical protein